jgi:hypothetical protein
MPEKKIITRTTKNGTQYIYYTLRAYRNKKGQPTSDTISIGKKDPKTGQLIPNRNYYDLFPNQTPTTQTPTTQTIQTTDTTTPTPKSQTNSN